MKRYWYKKNKTQLLRGFCAVMEEGSTIKASKVLNIATSSISLQISSLERDLGFQLFRRENQKLVPLEEAKRLYKVCKKTLAEIDMIFENSMEVIKQDYDNIVRLAGHSFMLSHILPPHFKKLLSKNKETKFDLHNTSYEESLDMLNNGIVDIAIFPVSKETLPKNIKAKEFYKCKFGIGLAKDHPLANISPENLTWELISKYDFITIGKGVTAQKAKSFLQSNGVTSKFNLHNGTWEICTGLIKSGLTISGTDTNYIQWHPDLIIKECSHLMPEYQFHVLTNDKMSVSESSKQLLKILSKP